MGTQRVQILGEHGRKDYYLPSELKKALQRPVTFKLGIERWEGRKGIQKVLKDWKKMTYSCNKEWVALAEG